MNKKLSGQKEKKKNRNENVKNPVSSAHFRLINKTKVENALQMKMEVELLCTEAHIHRRPENMENMLVPQRKFNIYLSPERKVAAITR